MLYLFWFICLLISCVTSSLLDRMAVKGQGSFQYSKQDVRSQPSLMEDFERHCESWNPRSALEVTYSPEGAIFVSTPPEDHTIQWLNPVLIPDALSAPLRETYMELLGHTSLLEQECEKLLGHHSTTFNLLSNHYMGMATRWGNLGRELQTLRIAWHYLDLRIKSQRIRDGNPYHWSSGSNNRHAKSTMHGKAV